MATTTIDVNFNNQTSHSINNLVARNRMRMIRAYGSGVETVTATISPGAGNSVIIRQIACNSTDADATLSISYGLDSPNDFVWSHDLKTGFHLLDLVIPPPDADTDVTIDYDIGASGEGFNITYEILTLG